MERRLAAVLAADVVGYCRLMETAEISTLAALKAHLKELIEPKIAEHKGRIVRLIGDGAIVEFASVVGALQCAAAIQHGMARRNQAVPEDRRVTFRIGINIGDVIAEGEEIHGDGVNVAVRLEGLSDAGGICVARNVFNQTKNKLPLVFEELGTHRIKNISEPVEIYRVHLDPGEAPRISKARRRRLRREAVFAAVAVALLAAGLLAWHVLAPPSTSPDRPGVDRAEVLAMVRGPSVAVLPFVNMTDDPKHEVFSDGITEEIITALSRFRDLHILARSTVFQYKGEAVDIQELARSLEIDYFLEGSVRRAGDTVRVTAQLIDGKSGMHLWAASFDRRLTLSNLIVVQDEIAAKVSSSVAASRGGAIPDVLRSKSVTKSPQELTSYECVLEAFEIWRRVSPELILRTRECLEGAVERDPYYADAWAMLSHVYVNQRWYAWGLSGAEAKQTSKRAYLAEEAIAIAQKAAAIAPDSAVARASLAQAYWSAGELERFRIELRQSLALGADDPVVLGPLGNYLAFAGWWEEGKALARKALMLAPDGHAKWWLWASAKHHFHEGEDLAALRLFEQTATPGFWLSQLQLAYTYGMLGERERAADAVAKLSELAPGFSIDDALDFHRMWNFQQSYLDRMAEGLRRAGLPKGAGQAPAQPTSSGSPR